MSEDEFKWLWKDTSRKNLLHQYYYDYQALQEEHDLNNEILNEIYNFCKECGSCQCCPEDECVLFRIEQKCLKGEEK